ncbi:MAG: FKBP-type peptidyl-prolyl cis-trans isomerase [Pyrinomonadaceae bacterium]
MKRTLILILLILNVFAAVALSQTRKPVNRRKPASVQKKRKALKTIPPVISSAAMTTASGLTYIITDHGAGAQFKAGDTVIVHYTGMLTNGFKFDSSLDRNEPFSFPLGAGRVIKGWDEGIQKMHVGDRATFIIPPQLGYGARGAGEDIPPNATLIFIVEAIGVQ